MEVTGFWLPVCNGMQIKEWDFLPLTRSWRCDVLISAHEMSKVFVPAKGSATRQSCHLSVGRTEVYWPPWSKAF